MIQRQWVIPLCAALTAGCSAPTLSDQHVAAAPALESLRSGDFDEAKERANRGLAGDPKNTEALLVRAIVRYEKTMRELTLDARTVVVGGVEAGGINQKVLSLTFEQGEADLEAVEKDLAGVARNHDVALELCLACWDNVDWTGDGRVDRRDELLLQVEHDEHGEPIPEGDPRRKPTFRFDHGDVAWARAFVSFERAALDLVLAYDWSGVNEVLAERHARSDRIVVRLAHPERVAAAKQRLLEGLEQSDAARRAYLAETDDDREWVPNPRQKSHPIPLPVDQALYDTWEGVVGDLGRLVRGEEGLGVADLARLFEAEGEVHGARGYIDLGSMLSHPRDISLGEHELKHLDSSRDIGASLSSILGSYYVGEMKASPLPKRLARMKGEMDAHEEDFEHKLRYLFWLN